MLISHSNNVINEQTSLFNRVNDTYGAHILYSYSDINTYLANALAFISDGILHNQHVLFIDTEENTQQIKEKLIERGYKNKLEYVLFTSNDVYLKLVHTSVNTIIESISDLLVPHSHYINKLRIWSNIPWGEMSFSISDVRELECKCDVLISQQRTLSICAYNSYQVPAFIHIELQRTHQYLMTDTEIVKSTLYNQQNNPYIQNPKQINDLNNQLTQNKEFQREYNYFLDANNLFTKVSIKGEILYISQTSKTLLGFDQEELIGRSIQQFIHQDDYHCLKQFFSKSEEQLIPQVIYRVLKNDGSYLPMNFSVIVEKDSNTKEPVQIILSAFDLTREKHLAESLEASQFQLNANRKFIKDFIDQIPEAIIIGAAGKILHLNPLALELLETTPNEAIGRDALDYVHPDYKEIIRKRIKQVYEQNSDVVEFLDQKIVTEKGNVLDVEVKGIPFVYNGKPASLSVVRNISQRLLNHELALKSEKLAVAGELAAGIAHEIRNPLTSIKGFLQLFKAGTINIEDYYTIMEDEINTIETISSELLVLGKPVSTTYEKHNIFTLVRDVSTLLHSQAIIKNINMNLELPNTETLIYCNDTQMKQVFINIIKNAIEATSENSAIHIKANVENNNVEIAISDQGSGIPAELMNKLGEPFFTTKEDGTGLGLMICFNIVNQHNGSISIKSEKGKGSTFTILLPIKE